MRRSLMSSIASFSMGLSYSALGAAALFAAYNYWAPPEDTGKASARVELGAEAAKRMLASFDAKDESGADGARHKWAETESRRELVRGIQRELQRVGCYQDTVDGVWSDTTLAAMKAFNRGVRVDIAVHGPDYILLTLLQGQRSRACGTEPGTTTHAQATTTHASPSAVVPPQLEPSNSWVTVTTAPVTPTIAPPAVRPLPARPSPATVARVEPNSGFERSAPSQHAPQTAARPAVEASVTTAAAPVKVAPPAGRMAVGGPVVAPNVTETSSVTLATMTELPPSVSSPVPQRVQAPPRQRAADTAPPRRGPERSSFTRDIFANISRNSP